MALFLVPTLLIMIAITMSLAHPQHERPQPPIFGWPFSRFMSATVEGLVYCVMPPGFEGLELINRTAQNEENAEEMTPSQRRPNVPELRPAAGAKVQVVDEDPGLDDYGIAVKADENGYFVANLSESEGFFDYKLEPFVLITHKCRIGQGFDQENVCYEFRSYLPHVTGHAHFTLQILLGSGTGMAGQPMDCQYLQDSRPLRRRIIEKNIEK